AIYVLDDQPLLALGVLAETDHARTLGQDRRLLGFARLEQIRHARQTAGDVAGLRGLLRDARDHIAHAHFRAVLDRHDRAGRQVVLRGNVGAGQFQFVALLVFQAHGRTQVLGAGAAALGIGYHRRFEAGEFVGLRLHRDAVDEVDETHAPGHFRHDRMRVRIPVGDRLTCLDLGAVLDRDRRTVRHLVALAFAAVRVDHAHFARTRHRNEMTLRVLYGLQIVEFQIASGLHYHAVHRRGTRSRTADVERAHGELRAWLADRLRGDHADRFANVDEMPTRQITAVAQRAHAELRIAGDRRTHLDALHAGGVQLVDHRLIQQRVTRDDRFVVLARRVHVLDHHAAEHALAQRFDHVAAFHDRLHRESVLGAAIGLGDHHVLRHVHQAPRQITRI